MRKLSRLRNPGKQGLKQTPGDLADRSGNQPFICSIEENRPFLGVEMYARKLLLLALWLLLSMGLPSTPESMALMTGCALMIYLGLHLSLQTQRLKH